MPRILTETVYTFDELSDSAKEKARDWFRECLFQHPGDWEFVYNDAVTIGAILGIEIGHRQYKTLGGAMRSEAAIFFSGFSSQGDGACFEGAYKFAQNAQERVLEHAPNEIKVARIARELSKLQGQCDLSLTARMNNTGRGCASHDMSVEVESDTIDISDVIEAELSTLMREFADWIYSQLEKEYEWQSANEQVDESILANEYTFTDEGKRRG